MSTLKESIKLVAVSSPKEIEVVVSLAASIWTEHYVPIIGPKQVAYMLNQLQSYAAISQQLADGYQYCLVLLSNQPVGYYAILPEPELKQIKISKIYTLASCRGNGIGSAMLNAIATLSRENRSEQLQLTVNKQNYQSIDWYQRRGFKQVASVKVDIGEGFFMDDYVMQKNLGAVDVSIIG